MDSICLYWGAIVNYMLQLFAMEILVHSALDLRRTSFSMKNCLLDNFTTDTMLLTLTNSMFCQLLWYWVIGVRLSCNMEQIHGH